MDAGIIVSGDLLATGDLLAVCRCLEPLLVLEPRVLLAEWSDSALVVHRPVILESHLLAHVQHRHALAQHHLVLAHFP